MQAHGTADLSEAIAVGQPFDKPLTPESKICPYSNHTWTERSMPRNQCASSDWVFPRNWEWR